MDNITRSFYKDAKKEFKKYSNEKIIMEALIHIISIVDETLPPYRQKSSTTMALEDELRERIKDK